MSFAGTAGLGAVAGFTILLGLPAARIGRPGTARLSFLNAASIGILLFIFFDVIRSASETITGALDHDRARGTGYAALLAAGLTIGVLGLIVFERFTLGRRRKGMPSGPAAGAVAGYPFQSAAVSVLFLALAAGAIVYVIGELQHAGRKIGAHHVAGMGILAGFLAGYATDLLLHAAGA